MQFIKGLGLGIYYRLRRMNKALRNWRRFGVIIFGGIFLLANLVMPLHLVDQATASGLTYLYIDPSTLSIEQGKPYQFKYRAEDQNHQAMTVSVQWSMNNSTAGSITQTGLFTASQTPGTYSNAVKLSSGALSTYARVIVVASSGGNSGNNNQTTPKLTYLYVDPSTLSIAEGKTYQMKYRAEDQNHNQITITPNWSMNNSVAGSINQGGLFTASQTPGTYVNAIKLSAGVLSTYARVIVLDSSAAITPPNTNKLTYLYIDPSTLSIEQGKPYQFKYRAEDQNHQAMTVSVQWSMNNSTAGSITQTGLFTASQTPGTYSNAVKLSSGALSTYARVIVYKSVPQIQLNSVAINPTSATLYVGHQKQFSATAYDQNDAAITSGVTFRWDIVNSQAGGITQTGLFTADNHPGTYSNVVKVTATYNNVSKSAYASVTVQTVVVNKVLTRVELAPSSARLHFGEQKQFIATAYDQNSQVISQGVTWHWFVNNSSAGQVTQTGLFTASSVIGNYSNGVGVTATFSGVSKSDYAAIEVYEIYQDQILTSVGIDPSYTVLEPGHSRQFTATAYDQDGQVISASFSWAVVNGGGSINQNGWFTANYQAGTYNNTVRVTATRNGVSKSAYATVLINEVINQALLERVEITPSSLNLRINQQYDFNAQAYDSNNNPLYSDVTYTWSVISGPGYIDQNGLFAANSLTGNATVQVRAMQGNRDRYALATVYIYDEGDHDYDLSYVRIAPSVAYLSAGSAVDFDAQAYDSDGQSVSATYTWDLMNSIGSLNQNGYFVAGSLTGTFNDAIRVRAYRDGVERIDYADVVISSSSQNNYGLNATLTATDENGGSTYEGDLVIYSLQLTNNYGNSLTNVNATFELPTYTTLISASSADGTPTIYSRTISWNAGTMYNGATKTLTIRVKVDSHIPSNAILRGKANVWASEINSFWVYANDLYVVGTGEIEDNGTPLTNTGALSWVLAGIMSLAATIVTRKWLFHLMF